MEVSNMKLGAQLYTIRNFTQTLEEFSESLKKIADIGYRSVQVSGSCAYEPEWLAEELKKNGLTCDLTHFSYDAIIENPEKVAADHKIFGCKYVGIGGMPGQFAGYDAFMEKTPDAARRIAATGSLLMYHNHAFEYHNEVDGKPALHVIAETFPKEHLGFTLDTHWVKAGGYDVVEEIKYFAGRIPCVHYKDLRFDEEGARKFAVVGEGILEMEKITEAFIEAGAEYSFVEQDNCYGEDPFACLKRSHDYLRSIGLKD